jgi:tRNA threonylcarbamoyladenosine biosynthesis protein TsaB
MRILALETATRGGSIALLDAGGCDARAGDATRTHGERLPREVLDMLAAHRYSISDVDLFAIVAGPGSFTGLRVGMASIQGLAMASNRKVVPVPTLEALAETWCADHEGDPAARPLVACLDGQRGDIFYAAWQWGTDSAIERAAVLIPARVAAASDLIRVTGELGDRAVVVQHGLERHADVLAALKVPVFATKTPLAAAAARMAARRPEAGVLPHALRPIYIRRPDAVLARERAGLTSRDRVGS